MVENETSSELDPPIFTEELIFEIEILLQIIEDPNF
jgi:hypothetical protein